MKYSPSPDAKNNNNDRNNVLIKGKSECAMSLCHNFPSCLNCHAIEGRKVIVLTITVGLFKFEINRKTCCFVVKKRRNYEKLHN